jgi:cell division cycle protein 37
MKLTLIISPPDATHHTELKLTLPTKWLEGPVNKIKKTFIQTYLAKHPEDSMEENNIHFSTLEGIDIADTDIIAVTFKPGQEVIVRKGQAPLHSPFSNKSLGSNPTTTTTTTTNEKQPPSTTTTTTKPPQQYDVTTKEGIEAAKKQSMHDFDYSKWNKLDLSDDDALDCHPNIELASWKRIKAQQRADRRQKEESEIHRLEEVIRLNKSKADELNLMVERSDGGNAQMIAQRDTAVKAVHKAMEDLEKFKANRKWVAEDVCATKEDRSVIAIQPSSTSSSSTTTTTNNNTSTTTTTTTPPNIGPISPHTELDDYDSYVRKHEQTLRMFVSIDDDREESEKFMLEHPEILCSNADGFLLLLCLDDAMKRAAVPDSQKKPQQVAREKAMALRLVRQHLLLNYVLELAKVSHADDVRAAVKPFFFKTSKQSKEQKKEFETEMLAFLERIEKRARDKLANGEKSPLARYEKKEQNQQGEEGEDTEYEPAGVGPGGLDPNEVLNSLPKEMQDAFVEQDVGKLRNLLTAMDPEIARYHLDRCIKSGLWVPGGGGSGDGDGTGGEDDHNDDDENDFDDVDGNHNMNNNNNNNDNKMEDEKTLA